METIPYIVHEGEMARAERHTRRWFIAFMVLLVMFCASWIGFVVYESQFQTVSVTAEQDAEGGNNYAVGGDFIGEAAGND